MPSSKNKTNLSFTFDHDTCTVVELTKDQENALIRHIEKDEEEATNELIQDCKYENQVYGAVIVSNFSCIPAGDKAIYLDPKKIDNLEVQSCGFIFDKSKTYIIWMIQDCGAGAVTIDAPFVKKELKSKWAYIKRPGWLSRKYSAPGLISLEYRGFKVDFLDEFKVGHESFFILHKGKILTA